MNFADTILFIIKTIEYSKFSVLLKKKDIKAEKKYFVFTYVKSILDFFRHYNIHKISKQIGNQNQILKYIQKYLIKTFCFDISFFGRSILKKKIVYKF